MTAYARATNEFQLAWTGASIQHWRECLDRIWRQMSDVQRAQEPIVLKEHYEDLRSRGVLPPPKAKT